MRLWHYKLIGYLPNQMLVSQWRECIAIKRQWEKGTLRHRLVKYIMNYKKAYFYDYVLTIYTQLAVRNMRANRDYLKEIDEFCYKNEYPSSEIKYYKEHNDIYLRECLYNLEEKAMRGIISKEEWQVIYNQFKDFTELWKGE